MTRDPRRLTLRREPHARTSSRLLCRVAGPSHLTRSHKSRKVDATQARRAGRSIVDPLIVFKALANPARLQFLQWLKDPAEHFDEGAYHQQGLGFHIGVCVGDIQARSGLSQSVVSSYLQMLKDAELLESERIGKWTYYRRNERTIEAFADYIRNDL